MLLVEWFSNPIKGHLLARVTAVQDGFWSFGDERIVPLPAACLHVLCVHLLRAMANLQNLYSFSLAATNSQSEF